MTPPVITGARPEIVTESLPDRRRPQWIQRITSSDHKEVAKLYIGTSLLFLAGTITLLVMMRLQLIIPENSFMRPQIFDRLLSVYGVSAVLLFAVPLLMGLITHITPLQIGARGTALPRLGALSYWLYLAGALTIYGSFLYLPPEAGTLALPPLSDTVFSPNNGVDAWAAGVGLVCLSMIAFAVNMLTTIRRDRAPGMVWRRVPAFAFSSTVVSWTMLVIGPIMLAAVTMLMIDRNFEGVFFDTGERGAPLLYEHLAWIFFTGIYAVLVVGAFGTITEIFSTFSRQPIFGARTIAGSMVAFVVLAILAWMQNMYSAPISTGFLYFAMLCAVAAIVPVGLIVFNWIGTLRGGAAISRTPLSFAVAAAVLTIFGLAGEWAQAVIPVSWQVANTGVAWGDTHFALIGAGLLGGLAALHYWFPKIRGRYMGNSLAKGSLGLIVLGTFVMVLPMQLAGLEGMPVDVYKYYGDTGMSAYNLIATLGSFALAVGIVLSLVNAAASWNNGTPAGPDAWGGATLEWFAPSPPPLHNFDLVPDVRSNEPFRDIREAVRRRSTELVLPPARMPESERPEPVAVGAGGGAGEGSGEQPTVESDPAEAPKSELAGHEPDPEAGETPEAPGEESYDEPVTEAEPAHEEEAVADDDSDDDDSGPLA